MYGIVNKAIESLIKEKFGHKTWLNVKETSGVTETSFISNESYPDKITYDLATAASEVLKLSLSEVLYTFGEYWILKTGQEHYGDLLKSGGGNFKEFMTNLPNFHSKVMLMYPNLNPPTFKIEDIQEHSLKLHYISHRGGLKDFVIGLLHGLGKLFKVTVKVNHIKSNNSKECHEEFIIYWE